MMEGNNRTKIYCKCFSKWHNVLSEANVKFLECSNCSLTYGQYWSKFGLGKAQMARYWEIKMSWETAGSSLNKW
jgi:hypothetical protein